MNSFSKIAPSGQILSEADVSEFVSLICKPDEYRGKKVLLIVPDGTRTAPVGMVFKPMHKLIGRVTQALDVMIALGTHQPMSEAAICDRLGIDDNERRETYGRTQFFNHDWENPTALKPVGVISGDEIDALTDGLFSMDVGVEINRRLFDYDVVFIIGPVFPHEVVGFSGGNKYLFPGVSGPTVLNFFHWLAGVITNPKVIGHKWTPVREVVDKAASMVKLPKLCISLVVEPGTSALAGIFAGTPEAAWDEASDLSAKLHIVYKEKPFHTILSCAPPMYDELWVGGKCMYKLEPVLADGGELIIYGPHMKDICITHGDNIRKIGYHCRDYILNQWDRFKNFPWGVLAHSTHVKGIGTFVDGVEKPRATVTLATGIPESLCQEINLGYRDPASIEPQAYADREAEGVLLVPKAGEVLYKLKDPPAWARQGTG